MSQDGTIVADETNELERARRAVIAQSGARAERRRAAREVDKARRAALGRQAPPSPLPCNGPIIANGPRGFVVDDHGTARFYSVAEVPRQALEGGYGRKASAQIEERIVELGAVDRTKAAELVRRVPLAVDAAIGESNRGTLARAFKQIRPSAQMGAGFFGRIASKVRGRARGRG